MEDAGGSSQRPRSPDLEAQSPGSPSASGSRAASSLGGVGVMPASLLKAGPGKGHTPASGRRMRWADEDGTALYELKYFERSNDEIVGAALRQPVHGVEEQPGIWHKWREAIFHLISVVFIIAFIVLISLLISRIS